MISLETWETRPEDGFHEEGRRGHFEQSFYELVQSWEANKNKSKQTKKNKVRV